MIAVGDIVVVTEENLAPWTGSVIALKFSPKSGWWATIRRAGDELAWSVCLNNGTTVTKVEVPDE